MSDFISLKLIV